MKLLKWLIAGTIVMSAPASSTAQDFPTEPVRIVVPYTAGGATDTLARTLADGLSKLWGQRVLIENKPGASGVLAANYVVNAEKDGHTLLFSDSSIFVIVPHIKSLQPWPFTPVALAARQMPVLATRKDLEINSVSDVLKIGREQPDKLSFGSFGIGTWSHVAMEGIQQAAGGKFVHVPYRGTAQVITDALGGRIDMLMNTMGAVSQHIESGQLKLLAVGTKARSPDHPNVPTVAEAIPGYSIDVWFGLVAPENIPASALNKIEAGVRQVGSDPEYRAALKKQYLEQGAETPEQFGKLIKSEFDRWGPIVKRAGITE